MKLTLIAVGAKMPTWIQSGFDEYIKRIPSSLMQFELIEIPAENRTKNSVTKKIMQKESEKILKALSKNHFKIALAIEGKMHSTEHLAQHLRVWIDQNINVDIVIGGPDGLASECLDACDTQLSLSKMTLPHPLARVIIAEQIYRACSILQNHPYHK